MELMVRCGNDANTSDTTHKLRYPGCQNHFLKICFCVTKCLGCHGWHKTMVEGDTVCMCGVLVGRGGGLVLFVQDKTQQQHTEMLRGATDSTDGRISEIPQGYKHISNPSREKSLRLFRQQTEKNDKTENTC